MITFAKRRWRNGFITLLAGVAYLAWHTAYDVALYQSAFLSGWLLLAAILVLTLYNGRKKLSMVPLGTASSWLQVHVYLGVLTVLIFALHIDWQIPNGFLERVLALFFVAVAGSGLIGIYISRRYARMLTRRTEEVVLERIPQFIAMLRRQAEAVALESAAETGSSTIADFYGNQLADYFARPRHMRLHLQGSRRAYFALMIELTSMTRYLNDQEMIHAEKLRALVERKNRLDYAYALQSVLKAWLFVHIPATYGLILLTLLHLLLAYSFGGAR
ncbi:MAG: hypothetical protein QF384_24530 [Alphaproteobacteria bacterium]|nr:hypothetical protein [Alphaproteobacteria bacterium]MDP6875454.1 hypothetical protein [Alphaproteobacteria bacterium]